MDAPPTIPVHADFIADLRGVLGRSLLTQGFAATADDDTDALLVRHLNVQRRKITVRPRPIALSAQLRARLPDLPDEQREALRHIEAASTAGDDLSPYLSRKVVGKKKKGDFNDRLLCEWDLHHLHLGLRRDADGKVSGTRDVLFLVARDEALYFVEVLDHEAFADQQLFEIIQQNWPPLVARLGEVPAPRGAATFSPAERAAAREAGLNALTTGADGRAYLPLGGGLSTDGSSSRVRGEADRVLDGVHALELKYRANANAIADAVAAISGAPLKAVHLKLIATEDGVLRVIEATTGIELRDAEAKDAG